MKVYDTVPKPAFLRALQNQSWTMSGALSELVDNSFGPGRGNADRVIITNHQKDRWIRVLDNGAGMDNLGRLFQLGNTIGRAIGDIGLYGSGGTMALLWLANRVDIWSLRGGKVTHDSVDWKECIEAGEYPRINGEWEKANESNTPHDLLEQEHGTVIQLWLQRERVLTSNRLNMVSRDLEETYAPGLRSGKEIIWKTEGRNGGYRSLSDPTPSLKKYKDISGAIALSDDTFLPFEGLAGIIEDLPHSKSAISIGYGARVITTTRDCFSSPDEEERYAGTGICGFVDLKEGWQIYLSTTKSGVNDDNIWRALMGHIFSQIRALLKSRDEARQILLLADLQMSLQSMFSGRSDLEITIRRPAVPDLESGKGDAEEKQEHKHRPSVANDDAEREAKTPALSGIEIAPQTDIQMERCLCRVERRSSSLIAYVNMEHPDVAESMKSRPANTRALSFLITGQIAEMMAKDDELRREMFPKNVNEQIDSVRGDGVSSYIMRLLVDRVRGHKIEAVA